MLLLCGYFFGGLEGVGGASGRLIVVDAGGEVYTAFTTSVIVWASVSGELGVGDIVNSPQEGFNDKCFECGTGS